MPCNTPPPPDFPENNAMEGTDDEIVYFEEDEDEDLMVDDSVLTFSGHNAAVLCCNLTKNKELAISGGQDDKALVWNTTTAQVLFECTGLSESVIAADFSPDDKYVATADLNGMISAWKVDSKTKLWNFESSEITWMKWHHKENILIAGSVDGDCWKCSVPVNNVGVFPSAGSDSICGTILPDGERCAVCYLDGSVRIWNINECSVIGSLIGPNAHKKAVTCVNSHPNNVLIATGDEDSNTKLIKSENCKVLWNVNCCSASDTHGTSAVESVDFFSSHPLMVTGTSCGCLAIWDIASQVQRFSCDMESSVVKLICHEASPWVFVGTSEGDIHLLDARTGEKERKYVGHNDGILDFTLSREGDMILSASDDNTCKVFHVN